MFRGSPCRLEAESDETRRIRANGATLAKTDSSAGRTALLCPICRASGPLAVPLSRVINVSNRPKTPRPTSFTSSRWVRFPKRTHRNSPHISVASHVCSGSCTKNILGKRWVRFAKTHVLRFHPHSQCRSQSASRPAVVARAASPPSCPP